MPLKSTKKKKKGVPKEKVNKLDVEADKILKNENLHKIYLQRINRWMINHYGRAIDVFRMFDKNSDGILSYDEFIAGMKDLDAPFTNLDLTVISKLLDTDNDKAIDYIEFSSGVRYQRPVKYIKDDGLPYLNIKHDQFEMCPRCLIKKWNCSATRNPRFIIVEVKHEIMVQLDNYPGHFRAMLHSHTFIEGIHNIIDQLHNSTPTSITVYTKSPKGEKKVLEANKTLEDYGYEGRDKEEAETLLLFYDFELCNTDCPILNCDYYFKREKKIL